MQAARHRSQDARTPALPPQFWPCCRHPRVGHICKRPFAGILWICRLRRLALAASADRDRGDFYRDLGYFLAIQGPAKPLEQRDLVDYQLGLATWGHPLTTGDPGCRQRPATAARPKQRSGAPAPGGDPGANRLL